MTETQALETALEALFETILDSQNSWSGMRRHIQRGLWGASPAARRLQAKRHWHARLARNAIANQLNAL